MAELLMDEGRTLDFGDVVSTAYEGSGWQVSLNADRHTVTIQGTDPSSYFQIGGYANARSEPFVSLTPYGPGTTITKGNAERFTNALIDGLAGIDALTDLLESMRTEISDGKMPTVPNRIVIRDERR